MNARSAESLRSPPSARMRMRISRSAIGSCRAARASDASTGPCSWRRNRLKIFISRRAASRSPANGPRRRLSLDLWLAEEGRHVERIVIPFDQILDAVKKGTVDAGLIIHEGQLTYHQMGLYKLWDAGEWWHKKTGLPLPLGLDVVRSDLGLPLAKQISQALRESIIYANDHPEEAMEYALQYGRGLDTALGPNGLSACTSTTIRSIRGKKCRKV